MTNFVPELGKVVLAFNDPSVKDVIASAGLKDRVTYAEAVGLPRSLVIPTTTTLRRASALPGHPLRIARPFCAAATASSIPAFC